MDHPSVTGCEIPFSGSRADYNLMRLWPGGQVRQLLRVHLSYEPCHHPFLSSELTSIWREAGMTSKRQQHLSREVEKAFIVIRVNGLGPLIAGIAKGSDFQC